jgi:hypothetical protein
VEVIERTDIVVVHADAAGETKPPIEEGRRVPGMACSPPLSRVKSLQNTAIPRVVWRKSVNGGQR